MSSDLAALGHEFGLTISEVAKDAKATTKGAIKEVKANVKDGVSAGVAAVDRDLQVVRVRAHQQRRKAKCRICDKAII